ncbi:hypothetical protein F5X97DRAFT_261779 [Nemania serpens]|nr:hypothetical protein F5X97DRAFT_261779 [Nemania serpens]
MVAWFRQLRDASEHIFTTFVVFFLILSCKDFLLSFWCDAYDVHPSPLSPRIREILHLLQKRPTVSCLMAHSRYVELLGDLNCHILSNESLRWLGFVEPSRSLASVANPPVGIPARRWPPCPLPSVPSQDASFPPAIRQHSRTERCLLHSPHHTTMWLFFHCDGCPNPLSNAREWALAPQRSSSIDRYHCCFYSSSFCDTILKSSTLGIREFPIKNMVGHRVV